MSLGREVEIWETYPQRGIWQAVVSVGEMPHSVRSLLHYLGSGGLCLETHGLLLRDIIVCEGIKWGDQPTSWQAWLWP